MRTPKPMKFWAVGLKGWVEIRAHPTIPRKRRSKFKSTAVETVRAGNSLSWPHYPIWVQKNVTRVNTQTVFTGGKVLFTISTTAFRNQTGVGVMMGRVVELADSVVKILFERNNYRGYYAKRLGNSTQTQVPGAEAGRVQVEEQPLEQEDQVPDVRTTQESLRSVVVDQPQLANPN